MSTILLGLQVFCLDDLNKLPVSTIMLPHQWMQSTHSSMGHHGAVLLDLSCYRIGNINGHLLL